MDKEMIREWLTNNMKRAVEKEDWNAADNAATLLVFHGANRIKVYDYLYYAKVRAGYIVK